MRQNLFLIFIGWVLVAIIALYLYNWLVVSVFHQPFLASTTVLILWYFVVYLLFAVLFPHFNILFAGLSAVIWQYLSWAFCQFGIERFCVTPTRRCIDILVSLLGFVVGVALRRLPDLQDYLLE